jgi:integrase
MADRYLAAHHAQPNTITKLRHNLKMICMVIAVGGAVGLGVQPALDLLCGDVGGLDVAASLVAALRQVYSWGIPKLVSENPGLGVARPQPKRGRNQRPFENWGEVERVAEEAGRWGPMIILAVDTGARPGELLALEHRHFDMAAGIALLPGTKTQGSRRSVFLTPRGIQAYKSIVRDIRTPLVFHRDGQPVDRQWWWGHVWVPAVKLAGLEPRPIYSTRHTFSFFSLMAGVPVADLSVELGHDNVAITSETYGHWSREQGNRAASLRAAWAGGTIVEPGTAESV